MRQVKTSVPANFLRIFLATAPEATLPMVSLAEDLPPPLKIRAQMYKLNVCLIERKCLTH